MERVERGWREGRDRVERERVETGWIEWREGGERVETG